MRLPAMAAPGPLALALLAPLASSPAFNVTESDDDDSSSACSAITSIGALDVCIGRIAAGTVLAMQLTAKIDCPDGAAAHACMDLSAPRSAPLMVTGSASSQNSTASPGLYRSNYSQPLLAVRGGVVPGGVQSGPTVPTSMMTTCIRGLTFEDAVWPNCYPRTQPWGHAFPMVSVQEAAALVVENCTFLRGKTIGVALTANDGVAFTGNLWLESQTFGVWTSKDSNNAVHFFGNSFLRGRNNAIIGVLSDSILQGNTFVYNRTTAVAASEAANVYTIATLRYSVLQQPFRTDAARSRFFLSLCRPRGLLQPEWRPDVSQQCKGRAQPRFDDLLSQPCDRWKDHRW
eukprot:COSAG02_NODE_10647_length_1892_cov_1.739543_3_plen_345_part_00